MWSPRCRGAEAVKRPLIEILGASVIRDGIPILSDISLTIYEGGHVAILGPNGCGKSTLIRLLTQEIYPYGGRGSVQIGGREWWEISQLRTFLGVVSEDPRSQLLGDPTGAEMAVSGLIGTYGVTAQHEIDGIMWSRAREALAMVDSAHLASQTLSTMSTGEKKRVWIARALVSNPRGLILDEPTNGLDMKATHEFHRLIDNLARAAKVTIVLVTHHIDEIVPAIERVVLIKAGRIIGDGPVSSILNTPTVASAFSITEPELLGSLTTKLEARQPYLSTTL